MTTPQNEVLTTNEYGREGEPNSGCTIVSFDCSSQERYAFLPSHLVRPGSPMLAKVAYHPETGRAFYRSPAPGCTDPTWLVG